LVDCYLCHAVSARAFDYRADERRARQRLAAEPLDSSRGHNGGDDDDDDADDADGDEDDEGNPALDAFDSNGARIDTTDSPHGAAAGLIGLRGGIDEFATCEAYTTPALQWLTLNHNVKTVLRCLRRVRSRCQSQAAAAAGDSDVVATIDAPVSFFVRLTSGALQVLTMRFFDSIFSN
jgi:hypothetical protein